MQVLWLRGWRSCRGCDVASEKFIEVLGAEPDLGAGGRLVRRQSAFAALLPDPSFAHAEVSSSGLGGLPWPKGLQYSAPNDGVDLPPVDLYLFRVFRHGAYWYAIVVDTSIAFFYKPSSANENHRERVGRRSDGVVPASTDR